MFDNIKDAMTFTKGERVAIIVLAAVILLIIAANFFVANMPSNVNENLHNLDSIIALHEKSLQDYETTRQQELTKDKSLKAKDKSLKAKDKSLKAKDKSLKAKDNDICQKPSPIANSQSSKTSPSSTASVNLNSADTTELISLPGIGSYFAKNIVSYREKLGGFIDINQLLEVYSFDSVRLEKIKPHIIIDSIETRKVKINHDDFKTILKHPYIEYDDVKKIVNYRESKGMIKNWEIYLKIVKRDNVDERLKWYLEF